MSCYLSNFSAFLQHSDGYGYWLWISAPPLLIKDTSLTVYFCAYPFFFYRASDYGSMATTRAAIREANASSTWSYTESFLSCYGLECRDLYDQNFTNSLVTQHTFSSLQPNTLYSLEFLGCLHPGQRCAAGYSDANYRFNIATRPAGE